MSCTDVHSHEWYHSEHLTLGKEVRKSKNVKLSI